MTGLENPSHPLWATIRFGAICVVVTFVLWRNANNFDETEVKTIIEIALMAGGYEGIATLMRMKKAKNDQSETP